MDTSERAKELPMTVPESSSRVYLNPRASLPIENKGLVKHRKLHAVKSV